jgi:RNAse (barnase) inhibitor barstar
MRIYSADTWTLEELQELVGDARRRALLVPAADTKKAVLEAFAEAFPSDVEDGFDLDALNDSLHDFADCISDDGEAPTTVIWQVPASFRADRSFGVVCEVLQDAERYAGKHLDFIAVCL